MSASCCSGGTPCSATNTEFPGPEPVLTLEPVSTQEPDYPGVVYASAGLELVSPSNQTSMTEVVARPVRKNTAGQEMIENHDPDFVPEGFHENRESDGGVKVTDKNKHRYSNIPHLEDMLEQGWASKTDKIYTTEETGCVPTLDEILQLGLKGYALSGRIVCEDGAVYNADIPKVLSALTPRGMQESFHKFCEDVKWSQDRENGPAPPEEYEVNAGSDEALDKAFIPPSGTYNLVGSTTRKTVDELTIFKMCDEPECLKRCSIAMQLCASGILPPDMKAPLMTYLKTRPIYTRDDPISGNMDICQKCIGCLVD
jgi:hypothetical protein